MIRKLLMFLVLTACMVCPVVGQDMAGVWTIEVTGKITSGYNYDLSNWKLEYFDTFNATEYATEGNTTYYYDGENTLIVSSDSGGKDTVILDMTYNDHKKGIYYMCFFQGSAKKLKGTGFAEAYVKIIHMNADTGEQWVDVDSTVIPIKCKMSR